MKKFLCVALLSLFFFTGKSQVLNTSFCQTPGSVYAVAIDSVNNIVYVGGSFTSFCGSPRTRLAAMNLTTGALLPWNPTANSDVTSLYVHNGALYVGGFFTSIGGQPHNRIAKFNRGAGALSTWNPNITTGNFVSTIVGKGDKIFFGGDVLITVGTGKYVAEVDTGSAAATPWTDYPNLNVNALAIDGNSLYVGGTFTQLGGTIQSYIAKYNLGGSTTLTAWNPNLDNNVQALCAKSGTLYAGGAFTFVATDPRDHIAEIDTSTGVATAWNPGANNDVFDLEYRDGILYALGNVSVFGGVTENFIGALDVTSNTATSWNAQITSTIQDAAIAGKKIFLGGGFPTVLGQPRTGFGVICIDPIAPISSSISTASGNVCVGAPAINYSVTAVPGATTYSWNYSGSGTVTTSGTTNSVNFDFSSSVAASGGVISVSATNGCQTSNTETTSVNVYDFTASISAPFSITCGDSAFLQGSDNYLGAGSVAYAWSPSTSLTFTNTTATTSGSQTTITYQLDLVSTEGCLATNMFTLTVNAIDVITTTAFGGNILCATKDTIFLSNDYQGAGSVTYTWSPSLGLNTSDPDTVVAAPVITTNYTLTASSSDGCVALPEVVNISVTPITLTPQASPATITCGNTSTLTVSDNYPGGGSITYTWSPSADLTGANTASPVSSATTGSTYSVDITTTEGCQSSALINVNVDVLQITPALGLYTVTCGGAATMNTTNNSANPNLVYSWLPTTGLSNTAISNPVAIPSSQTIYTVTMSLPASGCADAVAVDTVNILAPATPNICEVTTNDSSKNNVIYWDKTPFSATDSFIVYRETTTNTYSKIATIAHTDSSFYVDTARSIGPANGNPNIGSYRYKISVKDSCGYEGNKSPYHNTVYFIDNQTGVFTWNIYAVEFSATPVTTFDLQRDNLNNGVWTSVGIVTGNQTTLNDPNYNTYQSIANWRVEANGFNCTATARQNNGAMGAIIKSKSNITNNRVVGIKNNTVGNVSIYPNPNSGKFVIDLGAVSGKIAVKIFNMLGEEIYANNTTATDRLPVDLGAFENGTYVIQLSNEKHVITKRIVKN